MPALQNRSQDPGPFKIVSFHGSSMELFEKRGDWSDVEKIKYVVFLKHYWEEFKKLKKRDLWKYFGEMA